MILILVLFVGFAAHLESPSMNLHDHSPETLHIPFVFASGVVARERLNTSVALLGPAKIYHLSWN